MPPDPAQSSNIVRAKIELYSNNNPYRKITC